MAKRVQEALNYTKDCDVTDQLLKRCNEYTPDYLELKLESYIPVFVYGTLKVGQKRADILKNANYLGEGYTATSSYVLENSEMDFPVAFQISTMSTAGAAVMGEVYMVHPSTMLELDRMECNGEMYLREMRWVYLVDQQIKNTKFRPSMKCWMYLGIEEFWKGYPTTSIPVRKTGEDNKRRIYEWNPSFSTLQSLFDDHLPF